MRAVALALTAALAATPAFAADAADATGLCMQRAGVGLSAEALDALARIPDRDRRLLALRGYLRAPDLRGRWSWSDAQVRRWERSPERERAMLEVAKVQMRFALRNPGYRLHVNTEVRSLDLQISRWNENASVGRAARGLAPAAAQACAVRGADAFAGWLRASTLAVPANLAVPGLSPHGQSRAFDFQVFAGETLVAGTDSTRIGTDWRQGGWALRLADAITASPTFQGPLTSPDEPWHYAYTAQ